MAAPAAGLELLSATKRVYKLKACMGEGFFASVWRAEDQETHASYAIKIFSVAEDSTDPLSYAMATKEHFNDGVVALMRIRHLRHPHLARLEESFQDAATGLYCIVMDLVEGRTLAEIM
jgi:serine/threonine protein kinase